MSQRTDLDGYSFGKDTFFTMVNAAIGMNPKYFPGMTRVSAWEFFGHNFREVAGSCLVFCILIEKLISRKISKNE